MAKPGVPWVDVVKEQFGEDVLKSLKKRWKEALQSGRVAHEQLTFFCRSEFQTLETVDKEMEDLLAKMLICTPSTWFTIITGQPCPKDVKEENVGVAFDASSRLRRAGVEYFHDRLVEQHTSKETSLMYLDSLQLPPKVRTLPAVPAKTATLRVVAISDTHFLQENLQLPEGDLLIHGGDLSYEESRSKDARDFEDKLKEFQSDFQGFLR